jgi:hypothetical protein
MSVRFSPVHWPFAALLVLAGLTLALLVPRRLTAGQDKSCTQSCPVCPSSQKDAAEEMVRRSYPVGDLVIPVCGAREDVCQASCPGMPNSDTTEARLISLITSGVAPETWCAKGGKGTIDYTPVTMTLIVSQTTAVHKQVGDLLTALRKEQDVQVALEFRFVCVDEDGFGGLGLDPKESKEFKSAGACDKHLRVNFLNDAQMVGMLKGTRGNCCCNVMQAPKITLFNGQCSNLEMVDRKHFVTAVKVSAGEHDAFITPEIEEVPVGVRLSARPTVSADRRFVNVSLTAELSACEEADVELTPVALSVKDPENDEAKPAAFTQFIQRLHVSRLNMDGCVVIPDGVTAVVSGLKRDRVERTEVGVPVLSDIPYLNRLFTNVGVRRGKECVLMMVTPRIIVTEEEEGKKTGCHTYGDLEDPCCPECCDHAECKDAAKKGVKSACCEADAKCCDEPTTCAACPTCQAEKLVEKYHQACAEGRTAEATQFAVKALAVDPACFHVGEKCKERNTAPEKNASEKEECPAPTKVSQLCATWQPEVCWTPDPTRNGALQPTLTGHLWLFGEEIGCPLVGDGSLSVSLFEGEPAADDKVDPLQVWQFDAASLKKYLKKDMLGWGYALKLPWSTRCLELTRVQLRVCYHPLDGTKIGLSLNQTTALTLEQPKGKLTASPAKCTSQEREERAKDKPPSSPYSRSKDD